MEELIKELKNIQKKINLADHSTSDADFKKLIEAHYCIAGECIDALKMANKPVDLE